MGRLFSRQVVPQRRGAGWWLTMGCVLGVFVLGLSGCAEPGASSMQDDLATGAGGVGGLAGAASGANAAGLGAAGMNANPTAGIGGSLAGAGAGTTGGTGTAGMTAGMTAGTAGDLSPPQMRGDFINLAPTPGAPLSPDEATVPATPPPAGFRFYPIENTFCRDGTGNGIYVRMTESDKLLIYFEGGGACTTAGFCHFNPPNLDSVLTGDGQTVIGTAFAVGPGRQQPGAYNFGALDGIFAQSNPQNPFDGWNLVYIPYCTGDVHFGSNDAGMVPNVATPQKFVGYTNTRAFISRLVPTFQGKLERVVITGASAGSFGAALNFSMIADAFHPVRVDAILDSGAPFEDQHWPACLQQSWRNLWKLDESFPPDCTECFQADGGGMIGLADFLMRKHPVGNVAVISSVHDEVIRLFFTPGENDCAIITTADPFEITTAQLFGGQLFAADKYQAALMGLRTKYTSTNRLASYLVGGDIATLHQHTFRARFYEPLVSGKSMAQFAREFLDGTMTQVGP